MATKTLYPVYITKDSSFSGILSANGTGEDYRTLKAWTDRIDIGTIAFDNKFQSISQACIVNGFRINFQLKNSEEIATSGIEFHCIPKLINGYSLNGNAISISNETSYGSEGTAEHNKNSWKSAVLTFFSGWNDNSFIGQNKLLGFYTYVDRPSAVWTTQAYMRNLTATIDYTPRYYAKFFDKDYNQIGETQTVNSGSAPMPQIAPDVWGYEFVGWQCGSNVYSGALPVGNETDLAFIATYRKIPVIKATVKGQGKISPSGENMVSYGVDAKYVITPGEDYYIKDVIVDGVSKGEISDYTFEDVTEDHTIEAVFGRYCTVNVNEYSNDGVVSCLINGVYHSTLTDGSVVKLKETGNTFTLNVKPNEGYRITSFSRISIDPDTLVEAKNSLTSSDTFEIVDGWQHSYNIEFEKIQYPITLKTDGNGSIEGADSIAYNEGAIYEITSNDHYRIKDILLDGVSVINDAVIDEGAATYQLVDITTAHTIEVTFKRVVFLSWDIEGNGTVSTEATVLDYGSDALIAVTADEGSGLERILVNLSSIDYQFRQLMGSFTFTLENITGDIYISVKFTDDFVDFTVNQPAEGGYIYGDNQGKYIRNSTVQLYAEPSDGWYFTSWSNGNTDAKISLDLLESTEITAIFEKYNYNVEINSNGNGKVETEKTAANYGDEVVITAVADMGYSFVSWSDGNSDNPRKITISDNVSLSATFTKESYTISASAQIGGKVIINDDESIGNEFTALYEDTVKLKAIPDEGYYFWMWNDGVASSERNLIVPAGDINLYAEFKKYEFFVDISCSEGGSATESLKVQYGDDLKVEITSEDGNKISNVLLDGESIYNRLTITKNGGSFLIPNIKEPHIVEVFFGEKIYKYKRKLIEYLPPVLQQVLDFIAITDAQQPLIGMAWNDVSFVMENQFIDTATEEGVREWEKELGIIPLKADTLEDRKRRLKALWVPNAKYTYEWLCNWLKVACNDENIKLPKIKDYTIETYLPIKCDYSSVIENMRKYVPANMLINPVLRFDPLEHKHFAGMALRVFIKRKIQSETIEIKEVTTE